MRRGGSGPNLPAGRYVSRVPAPPKLVCAVTYKVRLFAPTVQPGTAPDSLLPLAEKHPGDDGTKADVDQHQNEIPAKFESWPANPARTYRYGTRHMGTRQCRSWIVRFGTMHRLGTALASS
mgnify:CR=1 FL=1